jgi:hypothetical protein
MIEGLKGSQNTQKMRHTRGEEKADEETQGQEEATPEKTACYKSLRLY